MLSCNESSFIIAYKDFDKCSEKPIPVVLISSIGLVFSIVTNFTLLMFFRSYQFADQTLLKRKFSFLVFPIQIGFLFLQYLFFISKIAKCVIYITTQFIGLSMILDVVLNIPFRDKTTSIVYSFCVALYEVSNLLMLIWTYTSTISSYDIIYMVAIFTPVLAFSL